MTFALRPIICLYVEDIIMSRYYYIDKYGYRCGVDITGEDDDIVVFNSTPNLSFDLKKHGIKIRRSKHYDYILSYALKDGQIFLHSFAARLSFFSGKSQIMGVKGRKLGDGNWSIFIFNDIFVDYSGTLSIGRTFDYRYWNHDEKMTPVPFSPEVYKENGYMKLEKGIITAKELKNREI